MWIELKILHWKETISNSTWLSASSFFSSLSRVRQSQVESLVYQHNLKFTWLYRASFVMAAVYPKMFSPPALELVFPNFKMAPLSYLASSDHISILPWCP